ncbi:MAG: PEGA domain-containing protein [Polyangiaceae bacterium]|jgi:hypothetical protein
MQTYRILLVAIALTFSVSSAFGADSADWGENDPGLDEAISRGISLRRAGNDEAALAVFLDVEKRDPTSVRVLLHISTAALAIGKWVMAYNYLQKASAHKDAPYYQRHLAAIENVARTIGERVGQFRVRGSPAGAEVRLNGEIVGLLPMNVSAVLETGLYTLEVSRPGYFSVRRPITITAHELAQEEIDLRDETSKEGRSVVEPNAAIARTQADSAPAQPWIRARWVTWTLAGAAVVLGTTSGIAFAVREQKANEWNDSGPGSPCLSQTNPQMTRGQICGSTRDTIDVAQGIGIGTGIAAVGFAGAAVIHWALTSRSGYGSEGTTASSDPVSCSPGLGSLVCGGSF